jgi:hypothetical protein
VTAFYLAASSTPSPDDVVLESRVVPPLAPGISSSGSTSVTIPAGTAAGTFYIIAKSEPAQP